MLKFKATDKQIQVMMANAVNASTPMGMGALHYKPGSEFKPEDFKNQVALQSIDYWEGRMVKLWLFKREGGWWRCSGGELRADYQSWISTYSTMKDLLASAGITEVEDEDV
jgi:hypothetical protein